MKKFVIVTDSCSDLDKSFREKYGIEYLPMHFSFDNKEYRASLDWDEISAPDFYNVMRGGTRIMTSQVNKETYRDAFISYINDGYDILSISCSSALSASVKASFAVRDELLEQYPDSRIICIDSLMSCAGLGLLCIKASKLRAEGKSIDEVAAWIEENKLRVNQEATVEKLTYLKQAGRVSAASAFFGGILSIKPIIISDVAGRNAAIEKVKGRKNSLDRIVERLLSEYDASVGEPIFVSHADAPVEAEEVKEAIIKALGDNTEIYTTYIGPIVGASVGPGTIGVYCYGTEVNFDAEG